MTKSTFPMTQQCYDKLLDELTTLETGTRITASQRVDHARSFCDFREDSVRIRSRFTNSFRILAKSQLIYKSQHS